MSPQLRRVGVAVSAFVVAFTVAGALRPAAAQQEKAQRHGKFEVYPDNAGQFRWRLKSSNGQVIATGGQGYKDKRDCRSAVESVKRTAAEAPIEEVEQKEQKGERAGAPDAAALPRPTGDRPAR